MWQSKGTNLIKRFLQVVGLHREVEGHEGLLALVAVRAALADLLIRKDAFKVFRKGLGLALRGQVLVDLEKIAQSVLFEAFHS